MSDLTPRNVGQTALDVIAAHNIADAIRPGEDRQRALYGGLTAAALYAAAPWLKEKYGDLGNVSADDLTMKDAAIVAGTAAAGAAIGYFWKPAQTAPMRVPGNEQEPKKPHPLLVAGSALYLAASAIDPSRSEEFKTRQRAGIIGGLVAYTTGPDLVEKVSEELNLDDNQSRRAMTGGVIGGVGGAMMRYVAR